MPVVMAFAIGATAASKLPDIDQKIKWLRHRKETHRPLLQIAFFALLAALAISWAPEFRDLIILFAASMVFGCVMHSVADSMTVQKDGIELLWPLVRRGFHLAPWSLRVWVGRKSTSERVFCAIWLGFVLIYAYARFGHLISS